MPHPMQRANTPDTQPEPRKSPAINCDSTAHDAQAAHIGHKAGICRTNTYKVARESWTGIAAEEGAERERGATLYWSCPCLAGSAYPQSSRGHSSRRLHRVRAHARGIVDLVAPIRTLLPDKAGK